MSIRREIRDPRARPTRVSVDTKGNVYIADTDNNRVRKVAGGKITTIAGTGSQGFSGDGRAAVSAQLDSPSGVAIDAARFGADEDENYRVHAHRRASLRLAKLDKPEAYPTIK